MTSTVHLTYLTIASRDDIEPLLILSTSYFVYSTCSPTQPPQKNHAHSTQILILMKIKLPTFWGVLRYWHIKMKNDLTLYGAMVVLAGYAKSPITLWTSSNWSSTRLTKYRLACLKKKKKKDMFAITTLPWQLSSKVDIFSYSFFKISLVMKVILFKHMTLKAISDKFSTEQIHLYCSIALFIVLALHSFL